jgi:hypothetical protein
MSADMKDVRNLVQNIAGIDRDKEKKFALAKALELDGKVVEFENQIKGAEDNLDDVELLKDSKASYQLQGTDRENRIQALAIMGTELNAQLSELQVKKTANDLLISQQAEDGKTLTSLNADIFVKESSIEDVKELAGQSGAIRAQIENSNKAYESNNKRNIVIASNNELSNTYNKNKGELESELQQAQFEFNAFCNEIRTSNDTREREYVAKVDALSDAMAKLNREYEVECNNSIDAHEKEVFSYKASRDYLANNIKGLKSDIVGYDRRISVLPSAPPLDTEFHKNIIPTYSYSYSYSYSRTNSEVDLENSSFVSCTKGDLAKNSPVPAISTFTLGTYPSNFPIFSITN